MTRWSFALLVLLAAGTARADGLGWKAPPDCPDDAAVRQAIERRLEASLDSVALTVDVEIVHGETGFVAQIQIPDAPVRTLTSAKCDELTDAVAVVVARLATEARAKEAPPAPVAVVTPPAPTPPPTIVERPPSNAGLRVSGLVGGGSVPSVSVAGELAAWLAWRRAFVELAVARWRSSKADLEGSSAAGVIVQLDAVALRAGWHRGRLRAWIGGEVGRERGTGVGVTEAHTDSAKWIAAGAGVGAAWPIANHVRVVVGGELEFAIDRAQFTLQSGQVLYRTSVVALHGGAGVELVWR